MDLQVVVPSLAPLLFGAPWWDVTVPWEPCVVVVVIVPCEKFVVVLLTAKADPAARAAVVAKAIPPAAKRRRRRLPKISLPYLAVSWDLRTSAE